MTYDKKLRRLTKWVARLKKIAKKSRSAASYITFNPKLIGTNKEPFVIVGGWSKGDFEGYSDIFYVNKKKPTSVMCLSIVANDKVQLYDFDSLRLPENALGEVEDTTIALEKIDKPETVAKFFLGELERINKECGNY